jgi:hypothetical protein
VDCPDDGVVLDRKRELPVEEHFDTSAAPSAPERARAAGLGERSLRLGSGDAVAGEPSPFLEGDDGEAGLLSRHSVDGAQREEAEVGKPLLECPRLRVRLSTLAGRSCRRRHDLPRRLRASHRPREGVAGEEPERHSSGDEEADRLHPRNRRHRVDELRDAGAERFGVPPGREALAQVDGGDAVREADRPEPGPGRHVRGELLRRLRTGGAGKKRGHGGLHSRARARNRDELLALEEVHPHRRRLASFGRRGGRRRGGDREDQRRDA